ncbi:MAG TPA: transglycosylase SLT domain-containing protein, partial [Hymenobacter sp.]
MANAENITALSGILTYDEAVDIPSMNLWMSKNGIDADTWRSMRKFATTKPTTATTSAQETAQYNAIRGAWNDGRVQVNKQYAAAQTQVDRAMTDPVFLGLTARLKALGMPSTSVDALTRSGWSVTALDANPEAMKPQYAQIIQQIKEYRTTKVDPLVAKRDAALAAQEAYPPPPTPDFNSGGGSAAPTTAPAGTRVAPPAVKTQITQAAAKAGVATRNLYALLGAESQFGTDTNNYRGKDYVGIGQIGADAQTDVNAKYGLKLDRNNPADNMEIAARYMRMQLDKYGNDPRKAYVAYNWGAGNLDKHLKRTGGKLVVEDLPEETQTGLRNLEEGFRGFDLKAPVAPPVAPPISSTKDAAAKPLLGPTLADLQGTPLPAKGKPVAANVLLDYMNAGKLPSEIGFSKSALYNTQENGKITSYCTRFAREYIEKTMGVGDRTMGKYFAGDATMTKKNFSAQGALYLADQKPAVAAQYAGSLKAGDLAFLTYANDPGADH